MILLTVDEACCLLRRHDTLECKRAQNGREYEVYHSLSEPQAKSIANLIEQMNERLKAFENCK